MDEQLYYVNDERQHQIDPLVHRLAQPPAFEWRGEGEDEEQQGCRRQIGLQAAEADAPARPQVLQGG